MRSPFYLTSTFSLNQSNYHITSDGYLLNHIEDALSSLNMHVERLNEKALFYRKTDFIKTMNRKNILRTLEVHVETSNQTISFTLKTEFVRDLLYCVLLFWILYFGPFHLQLVTLLLAPFFVCAISLIIKRIVLSTVKHDLIHYFEQLKH